MLTAELVRVTRRKGSLHILPMCGLSRERASSLLDELLALAKEHHGQTRGDLRAAFDEVVVDEKEERGRRAAQKLVLDRLEFAPRDDVDPAELRAAVFAAAAVARRAGTFDRASVVAAVANDHTLSIPDFEAALYADLEDAHIVDAASLPVQGSLLVDDWQRLEMQALLLRAHIEASQAEVRKITLHQLHMARQAVCSAVA